jgi:hypothetical protein
MLILFACEKLPLFPRKNKNTKYPFLLWLFATVFLLLRRAMGDFAGINALWMSSRPMGAF